MDPAVGVEIWLSCECALRTYERYGSDKTASSRWTTNYGESMAVLGIQRRGRGFGTLSGIARLGTGGCGRRAKAIAVSSMLKHSKVLALCTRRSLLAEFGGTARLLRYAWYDETDNVSDEEDDGRRDKAKPYVHSGPGTYHRRIQRFDHFPLIRYRVPSLPPPSSPAASHSSYAASTFAPDSSLTVHIGFNVRLIMYNLSPQTGWYTHGESKRCTPCPKFMTAVH
ncbi:hypothetical protein R3P38DRAFT_3223005 [Favolaschia claudopus]|uniref:Uncharacterized protein n=1 Tax=Favolaschia claudopus TaxID=2862362 RepID=A0AAV9ZY19_9AGAR